MNIKQIMAGGLAALAAGSTMAFGAFGQTLDKLPAPFITSAGAADVLVVVGNAAAPSDVVGAIDIAARLGGESTTTVTVTTASGGGAAGNVATPTRAIYIGDKINAAKTTFTRTELNILSAKVFSDNAGTDYKYEQSLDLSSTTATPTYGKPTGQTEPFGFVNQTSGSSVTATARTYALRATFTDPINLSNTNVQGQIIDLFGLSGIITSASTSGTTQKLVLAGADQRVTLKGGEKKTVELSDGAKVDLEYSGSSSTTVGVLIVNGVSYELTEKVFYNNRGGLDMIPFNVFQLSTTDQTQNSIDLGYAKAGAGRKITLENGQNVKTGPSDTSIDGTTVTITGSGAISQLTVSVGAKTSSEAFIKEGTALVDPVFGTFQLAFSGYSPALDSTSRSTVKMNTAGSDKVAALFTTFDGKDVTLEFARDPAPSTSGSTLLLQDSNQYNYHLTERDGNKTVALNDYFVSDGGDESHVFQVSSLSSWGTSSAKISLNDKLTGVTTDVGGFAAPGYTNTSGNPKVIGGVNYHFSNISASGNNLISVTWAAGSDSQRADLTDAGVDVNNAGSHITVFPGIKLKDGNKLYLTNQTSFYLGTDNVRTLVLPSGLLSLVFASSGLNYTVGTTSAPASPVTAGTLNTTTLGLGGGQAILVGQQWYNVSKANGDFAAGSAAEFLIAPIFTNAGTANGGTTTRRTPGMMVKSLKDFNSNYNFVHLAPSDDANGINVDGNAPTASALLLSGTSGGTSTLTKYLDVFGTRIDQDTSGQGTVTVWLPSSQAFATLNVLKTADAIPAAGVGTGSQSIQKANPIKTALGKLDTEVTDADKGKNVVLVGGPAVNTLVADLATAGKTKAAADYRAQGEGYALLDLVKDAFTTGKSALVVAGHSAADTRTVATVVQQFDTQKLKGTTMEWKNGVQVTAAAPAAASTAAA